MEIKQVSDVLNAVGLTIPTLIGLIPNVENYKVVLFQPKGEIDASAAGVKNRDGQSAQTQFAAFLDLAVAREVDLAVTPEYSMPWKVLVTAIKNGISPTSGKLWALGCESISYDALEHLKAELADKVLVLFEALKADPTKFVDPLAYVFRAQSVGEDKTEKIVVLVQFKTTPMADNDHLELKHLQRGTRVYQFGNHGSNRLISFICSDVFGFTDGHAAAVYDRTLVIHIQLNPKPRETQYRQYREKLLGLSRDETELICLNWASDVSEWAGDKKTDWRNISGTAWYLRPDKFDSRDETLCANHKRGLYYTWLKTLRFHSLFFNYKPCIFFLDTSKVAHQAVPAVVSRRRGPQLTATFVWDFTNSSWAERASADDGFAAFLAEAGDAKVHVETVSADNPLRTERLLALSAGQIGSTDDWHSPGNLDSFAIDASEVIRRMTFCQDTDDGASKFRVSRLKRC